MKFTITTNSKYREIVVEILHSMDFIDPNTDLKIGQRVITLETDEGMYRSLAGWGADALACGLIFGFHVER